MKAQAAGRDGPPAANSASGRAIRSLRALFRSNELALVAIAALVGFVAALCVTAITQGANAMHMLIYRLPFDVRLSASDRVSPWVALAALSLGGLGLGLMENWRLKRKLPAPVDPIEANALRGGRMSLRDSFIVGLQTTVSNGCGASVGLEAGYAQVGASLGSFLGQQLRLRRSDLRLLVGAGAAAAIGGSFGAPLTGAFYAFEIILGAYTIAGAGPIFTASIVGVLTTHVLNGAPYQITTPPVALLVPAFYPVLFGLAALSTAFGVAAMRAAGLSERALRATKIPVWAQPVIGGVFVAALASITPQVMGAGHGALALDIATAFPLSAVIAFLALKVTACMVSLATGFRGGLFFGSLMMGALLGKIYAIALGAFAPALVPDPTILILAGMATLGVVIVGGPLTMSFLVLENTSDFSVAAGVLAASIASSLMARASFGYSFSTWRLHLRGENIRSANDISWIADLTVGRLMRTNPPTASADVSLIELCAQYPIGATKFVVLTDEKGRYAGLINLAEAYIHAQSGDGKAAEVARFSDVALTAEMNAKTAMAIFDKSQSDHLAVIDSASTFPIGLLSEPYLARRYAEKADAAARNALGM
jgi:CIC family chloride channel protein